MSSMSSSSTSFSERLRVSGGKSSYLQPSDSFLYKKGTATSSAAAAPQEQQSSGGCYRATNLWLRAVSLFRGGVPLGRHRGAGLLRVWRSYDDTFIASEAVTWMVNTLREEQQQQQNDLNVIGGGGGGNVTRDKIVLLLDKFLQAGVFQHAEVSGGGGQMTGGRFKDDRGVYRLCPEQTEEDVNEDKENSSSSSAVAAAASSSSTKTTRGMYVTEVRCTPLSLPQVYALWEEAFHNRVEEVFGGGSVPQSLQSHRVPGALLKRNCEESVRNPSAAATLALSASDLTSLPPSWLSSAMRFLTHYPNWKLSPSVSGCGGGLIDSSSSSSSSSASFYPNMCADVLGLVTEYYRTYPGIRDHLRFDEIRVLFQDSLGVGRPQPPQQKPHPHLRSRKYNEVFVRAMSESTDALLSGLYNNQQQQRRCSSNPPEEEEELFYATEFFSGGSPLTRVVSERDLRRSAASAGCYVNSCLTLSPCDLINHPKYAGVKRRLFIHKHKSLNDLNNSSSIMCGVNYNDTSSNNDNSVLQEPRTTTSSSSATADRNLFLTRLRVLFLSYPFGVRRHLHSLLKFMGAVARNKNLNLDVAATNKDIMLSTYCDLVFGAASAVDDPYLSLYRDELLWRMVEEVDESLFAPDDHLRNAVADELQRRQVQRVKVWRGLKDEEGGDVYCAKVSVEEYDEQAYALRNKGLRDLLDAILQKDDNKARRRLVKKFRDEYPHIYAEKFGFDSSSSSAAAAAGDTTLKPAAAAAAPSAASLCEKKNKKSVRKVLGVL